MQLDLVSLPNIVFLIGSFILVKPAIYLNQIIISKYRKAVSLWHDLMSASFNAHVAFLEGRLKSISSE